MTEAEYFGKVYTPDPASGYTRIKKHPGSFALPIFPLFLVTESPSITGAKKGPQSALEQAASPRSPVVQSLREGGTGNSFGTVHRSCQN